MYCLKCGKETDADQVFCNHCLETMEQYPVKPGTPVQLPKKENTGAAKKQHRRRLTMEEQNQRLRVTVRTLLILNLILLCLLGYFGWSWLNHQHITPELPVSEIGQNYTVEDSTGK